MKLVIFDMDGTILNTIDDIAAAVNYIMDRYRMKRHSIDEVKGYVGNGLYRTLERAVAEGTDKETIEHIYTEFIEYYNAHANVYTKPYDGIVTAIKKLRMAGIKTAVVSNKRHEAVLALCEEHFKDCFDIAIGDREGIELKPAPDMVNLVLSELNIQREDVIFIGDSDVDLLTARNAGLNAIAVTWGFREEKFLLENGAERLAHNPEELYEMIMDKMDTKNA